MSKINHSKYKNTYLLYEFLIRQATEEAISNINLKESKAYYLIKKYFKKGDLCKELNLYEALMNTNVKDPRTADYLVEETIKQFGKLSKQSLKSSKYNLINEAKKHYNIDKLFSTPVSEYKEAASVYLFLEHVRKDNIVDKVKYKTRLVEHLTKDKRPKELSVSPIFENSSKDEVKLAYQLLVKRFNKIMEGKLNENQQLFIRDYVYKTTHESEWISEHINRIDEGLTKKMKSMNVTNDQDNQVLKLKIEEAKKKINELSSKKIFGDDDYYKIMKSYELIDII
jgi:hypothetical protein